MAAKRKKKNGDSLRNLWDIIKWTSIHKWTIVLPEGEERGAEISFEETMSENCSKLEKKTELQIQKAQKIPDKEPQKTHTRIKTKMSKVKDKERTLQEARGKKETTCFVQGNPQKTISRY